MHAFISIVCIVVVVVVCQILNVGILTLLDRRIPEEKIQDHFLADPAVLAGVIIMVVFQTIHMIVVVISSIKLAKQVCCVCLRVRVCLCVCVLVRACACVCMCACGVYFDACASCFLTCCLCLGLRVTCALSFQILHHTASNSFLVQSYLSTIVLYAGA